MQSRSRQDSDRSGVRWTPCPTCKVKFRSDDSDSIRRIYVDSDDPLKCKVLLLGDSAVGKSSLLKRFSDKRWVPEDTLPITVGIDFKMVKMKVKERRVELSIWDTAGQERYRSSMTPAYYRKAQGIILVYDVSNKASFEALPRWYAELKQHVSPSVVKIIVGNKADMETTRQVATADGQAFATCVDSLFIETSAMTAVGVRKAFKKLAAKILDTPELWESTGQSNSSSSANVRLDATPTAATWHCWC